jgi:cell wall assembly regulator SMI1
MRRVREIVEKLRTVAEGFAVEERPNFLPGASAEAIVELEKSLAAKLPEDFNDFLRTHEAITAMEIRNGYWVGGIALIIMNVRRGDFPPAVAEENGPDAVVPVATDGGGNAFLMSLRGGTVWKWDHETGGVRIVADNFTAFLGRILQDWQHFQSGDGTSDYLSG